MLGPHPCLNRPAPLCPYPTRFRSQPRDRGAAARRCTGMGGIGRGRVEPGFLFEVVDEVIEVPDAASVAAMRLLEEHLGRRYGGSSGTNLVACLPLAARMHAHGATGGIVTLLCDPGARYATLGSAPAREQVVSDGESIGG